MGNDDCTQTGVWTAVTGLGLIIGTWGSFLPQIVRIIYEKDSTGVSLMAMWLVTFSAVTTAAGANMLQYPYFICCLDLDFLGCNNLLLSYYQLLSRFIAVFPLYTLALIYHPDRPGNTHLKQKNQAIEWLSKNSLREVSMKEVSMDEEYDQEYKEEDTKRGFINIQWSDNPTLIGFWDMYVFILVLTVGSTALSIFLILSDVHYETSLTEPIGQAFGYISAAATCMIWAPQIYSLYKSKDPGSLSLIMFIIQAPGGLLTTIFQAYMEKQPVSLWIGPFIAALEQVFIIFQILYYNHTNPRPAFESIIEVEAEKENWSMSREQDHLLEKNSIQYKGTDS